MCLALAFTVTAPASAESPAEKATARALATEAADRFAAADYAGALERFAKAYQIVHAPTVGIYVARTHEKLGQLVEAQSTYRELLSQPRKGFQAGPIKAALKSAQAELDALSPRIPTLAVTVEGPPASDVTLDDKPFTPTKPGAPVQVNPGKHKVRVEAQDYQPYDDEFTIGEREQTAIGAKLTLLPAIVTVTVVGAPKEARVRVDGKPVGPPPWKGDVAPGERQFDLVGPGLFASPKKLDLKPGATAELALELKYETGHLLIDAVHPSAEILIDGEKKGSGMWEGDLPVGRHVVTVQREGFEPWERVHIVHLDEKLADSVKMTPKAGSGGPEKSGGLFSFALDGLFGVTAPDGRASKPFPRPLGTGESLSSTNPIGGGIDLRGGYHFGYIGIEAVVLATYDRYMFPSQSDVSRFGGGGGLGVRFLTRHPRVGFTFGAAGGGVARAAFSSFIDSANATTGSPYASVQSYGAPFWKFDLALLLRVAKSTNLRIGGDASFEVPLYQPPNTGIGSSVGVHLGPSLGIFVD